MWAVLTFQNIVEIYGRVKNCKSQSLKYFCWVFEIDFEKFFVFSNKNGDSYGVFRYAELILNLTKSTYNKKNPFVKML